MYDNNDEKKEEDETFKIQEVVIKENNIIMLKQFHFLEVENLFQVTTSSKYLAFFFRFLPKVLNMRLKFDIFEFYKVLSHWVLILKEFRTQENFF